VLRVYRPHLGVDYAAPAGTPIVSIGDGTVTFAGNRRGYGRTVEIRHSSSLTTHYAHLSRFAKGVRAGARVSQGQVIGYVGSTGLSTGPHLDFRCKVSGRWVNPLTLERPVADPVPAPEMTAFREGAERYRRVLLALPCCGFLTDQEFEQCLEGTVAGGATTGHATGAPG
jgi:hypothetical protein